MPETTTTSGRPWSATAVRVASARVRAPPRILQRQAAAGCETVTTS